MINISKTRLKQIIREELESETRKEIENIVDRQSAYIKSMISQEVRRELEKFMSELQDELSTSGEFNLNKCLIAMDRIERASKGKLKKK